MIIDDEPLAIQLLENFIKRTPSLSLAASYDNSVAALSALQEHPVNILFLDIQMPDLDGMTLSHLVPQETRIIFTTAFKQYAFDSYDVNALDYLLKPISYQKFLKSIAKAMQWFTSANTQTSQKKESKEPEAIFVKSDSQLVRIDISNILYVSGLKDYVQFYFDNGQRPITALMTMKAIEELLPAERFMRVHRSYIVALDKIRSIDRNSCIYIGKEVIHVSDAYRDIFNTYLQDRTK